MVRVHHGIQFASFITKKRVWIPCHILKIVDVWIIWICCAALWIGTATEGPGKMHRVCIWVLSRHIVEEYTLLALLAFEPMPG